MSDGTDGISGRARRNLRGKRLSRNRSPSLPSSGHSDEIDSDESLTSEDLPDSRKRRQLKMKSVKVYKRRRRGNHLKTTHQVKQRILVVELILRN